MNQIIKGRTLCLAALVLFFGSLSAQTDTAAVLKKISDDVFTNGKAYINLRFLCKQVGQRLSGSPGAAKAVVETARMLREAGADTVYLQECMVPHWVRGAKEVATLQLGKGQTYNLKVAALGNSVGTPASGIKAQVVEVKNFDELNKLGEAGVKGKIVFYNYPMNPTYLNAFRAYGEAGIYRGRGPSMAAKYGAIGVITRTLSPNLDDYPHTGSTVYNDSFPKLPAVAVSTNDAEYLSKALASGPKEVYIKTNCKMLPDTISYNVIGEIRGSEFPDEVLTVGGHLDSWDLAEGAHDDGAGCVQSIEVIRTFKSTGIRPKRTIRAVMFMNEENGLRGGTKYAEIAASEKDKKFIFALESDAGGFTPRGFGYTMNAQQAQKFVSWKNLFYPYGANDFVQGGGGADIGPLYRQFQTPLAGLNPDSQRYMALHHATNDVFEEVSERELKLGAIVMTQLMWLVSEYGL